MRIGSVWTRAATFWTGKLHDKLCQVLDHDDAPLCHAWRRWQRSAFVSTLTTAAEEARKILRDAPLPAGSLVQAHFLKMLENRRVLFPCPEVMWDRRLVRWRTLESCPPAAHIIRGRVTRTLQKVSCMPPSTRWAVVRLWLNGWCTGRRFQKPAACTFCGKMEDSIEHFARCPVVREVGNLKLSLGLSSSDPLRFLLLDGAEREATIWCRHAAYIHAVFSAHNACRHGARPPSMADRLWTEFRAVCMQHGSVIRHCGL